jgi:hypothetical protein
MKKLLLLFLAMAGYVGTVSAETIRVYFRPCSNWLQLYNSKTPRFAMYMYNESIHEWTDFTYDSDIDAYYGDFDTAYSEIILCRCNPDNSTNDWGQVSNQTPGRESSKHIYAPTQTVLYTMDDSWDDGDVHATTYFHWKYYFLGNFTSESFTAGAALDGSDGIYTGTLTGKAGKNFVISSGEYIDEDGNFIAGDASVNWSKVIRPVEQTELKFATISNATSTNVNSDQNWSIDDDIENLTITITPSENLYSVTCTKTVEINSVGYNTYSNGEKCTISGATPYTISRENTNSTVHMQPWNSETVWPANEGMILKGTPEATVTIHSVASDATPATIGTNYLVGSGNSNKGDIDVSANGTKKTIYVLANKTHGIGFYLATAGTLPAHKAYLDLSSGGEAREFLGFSFDDEEINGIAEAQMVKGDGIIYNLQGVRLSQLQKGLNIVNGKKMLVK